MIKNYIFVDNYETECFIGVYPQEKGKKQIVKISVKLGIKRYKKEDTIRSTVSYEEIINQLGKVKEYPHINLVETLAAKIAEHFESLSNINYIKIEVIKKSILKDKANVGYVLEKTLLN